MAKGPPPPKRLPVCFHYGLFFHLDTAKVTEGVTRPLRRMTPAKPDGKPHNLVGCVLRTKHRFMSHDGAQSAPYVSPTCTIYAFARK